MVSHIKVKISAKRIPTMCAVFFAEKSRNVRCFVVILFANFSDHIRLV